MRRARNIRLVGISLFRLPDKFQFKDLKNIVHVFVQVEIKIKIFSLMREKKLELRKKKILFDFDHMLLLSNF